MDEWCELVGRIGDWGVVAAAEATVISGERGEDGFMGTDNLSIWGVESAEVLEQFFSSFVRFGEAGALDGKANLVEASDGGCEIPRPFEGDLLYMASLGAVEAISLL